ncbi:MAG: RNA polymerase subunit sigma-70 [Sphingomonas sp.]|nr:MAG: RNA polymerase subunit sigma-70 [Sphingomonas sp.]
MTQRPADGIEPAQGIEAVMLAHRAQLLRFLASHTTADDAEDLFHELWLRITHGPSGPVANPLAYLYRAANNLAIDRHRAQRQSLLRDQAWAEQRDTHAAAEPGIERQIISREELAQADRILASLGERTAHVVRRFRLEGVPQRQIAAELGISLSTVESDLRRAYAALLDARRQSDEP